MVYETGRTPAGCTIYSGDLSHRFRPDSATAFGDTWQNDVGRIRVDGVDLQLGFADTSCASISYVVAGVR